jgi:hypothetical protein
MQSWVALCIFCWGGCSMSDLWRQLSKLHRQSTRRRSTRRDNRQGQRRENGKGYWQELSDVAIFRPHQSDTLQIWRDSYRLQRQIRNLERDLYRPPRQNTWISWLTDPLCKAWWDFIDEIKALLTVLFWHVVTLVLVIAFNVAFFWLLFKVIGLWLAG